MTQFFIAALLKIWKIFMRPRQQKSEHQLLGRRRGKWTLRRWINLVLVWYCVVAEVRHLMLLDFHARIENKTWRRQKTNSCTSISTLVTSTSANTLNIFRHLLDITVIFSGAYKYVESFRVTSSRLWIPDCHTFFVSCRNWKIITISYWTTNKIFLKIFQGILHFRKFFFTRVV